MITAWILLALGCERATGVVTDGPPPPPVEPPVEPPPPDTGLDPADSGHSAAPPVHTAAPDPCATLPPIGRPSLVSDVLPSEEFAFDPVGHVLNAIESSGVYRTDYAGTRQIVSPGGSWEFAGARTSPDGTFLALCDEGAGVVLRVDLATGAREPLVAVSNPNSIGWDDFGALWIAADTRLLRYFPSVGGAPELVVERPGADLDGVTFAPDGLAVYFNDDTGGDIGRVDLDATGAVVGAGFLASVPGVGPWAGTELDGMTTDVCGNLYAVKTNGELVRVSPGGAVDVLIPATGNWTTSVNFGSGVGGWARDRLYVMDRTQGLWELPVGVEGHPEPHLP